MLRFAVKIEKLEQLEVLLGTAKVLGLTPELGQAEEDQPPSRRPKGRTKKAKAGKGKPKRYPPNMQVRMSKAPVGPPQDLEVHKALVRQFRKKAFRKGDAKELLQALEIGIGGLSGRITNLLDNGAMVAA